jgi:hypothetical protein
LVDHGLDRLRGCPGSGLAFLRERLEAVRHVS